MKIKFNKYIVAGGLLSALAGMAVSSCSDKIIGDASQVELSKNYISLTINDWDKEKLRGISSLGGSTSIYISGRGECVLSGIPAWATADKIRFGNADNYFNEDVKFEIKENDTPAQRTAIVTATVKSDDMAINDQMEMSQQPGAKIVNFNEGSVTVSAKEQDFTIEYTANVEDDELDAEVYFDSWLSITKMSGGKMTLSSEANTGASRSTTIRIWVKDNSGYSYINVTQSSPEGSINGTEHTGTVGCTGGNVDITFTSEVPWKGASSDSWLTVSPAEGEAGTHRLTLSVSPNLSTESRSATVTLGTPYVTMDTYTVMQQGIDLSVDCESLTIGHEAGADVAFGVSSNTDWIVAASEEWLTVSPAEGSMEQTVTVLAEENNSLNTRSAIVTVSAKDNNAIACVVKVTQNGIPYGVDNDNLVYDWNGGTQKVVISTPESWQCAVSDSWISTDIDKGEGDYELSVSCEPNTGEEERGGYVMIQSEGQPMIVNVRQRGQYFYIDNAGSEISAMGGTIELTVHTTVGAVARIEGEDCDWLSFAKTDEDVYMIEAAYNPSITSRTATFIIEPSMEGTNEEFTRGLKYELTQNGRRLLTSVPGVYLNRDGGQSAVIDVTADGAYDIYKDPLDNWYILTYDAVSGTFYVSATENKTGSERRGTVYLALKDLPDGETKMIKVSVLQTNDIFNVGIIDFVDEEEW